MDGQVGIETSAGVVGVLGEDKTMPQVSCLPVTLTSWWDKSLACPLEVPCFPALPLARLPG